MRLWFSHSSEVPIYRQMVTQVGLAIVAGDLKPGQKLPSTRELARRFGLHPNTVSAGYRALEREGWTMQRRGSGVYVRKDGARANSAEDRLDAHIAGFFRAAREMGLPAATVRARVAQWLAAPAPDHLLLVEPDAELRRILSAEIREGTSAEVRECGLEDCAREDVIQGAVPVCRPSQVKAVRLVVPKGVEVVPLGIRSAHAWLAPWLPAPPGHLVGVASAWPEFLENARTMLVAAGVPAEALMLRDTRRAKWARGLETCSVVLCEAVSGGLRELPKGPQVVVYRVLADGAAEALQTYLA